MTRGAKDTREDNKPREHKRREKIKQCMRAMESYLNEHFGRVKSKNSSDEALEKWRKVCGLVKNPKRRFRFTANISKREEAAAMRRTNQQVYTYMYIFICLM